MKMKTKKDNFEMNSTSKIILYFILEKRFIYKGIVL